MWLWNVKAYISFDTGAARIDGFQKLGFQKFEDEQQFASVADALAAKAAETVLTYRQLFPTVEAVSDHYIQNPPAKVFWPCFNAAISHGLSGRGDLALATLGKIIGQFDPSIAWQKEADIDARHIASIIQEPEQFRLEMRERVSRARELHKLPPVDVVA